MRTRGKNLHLRMTEQEHKQLMTKCKKCGLKPQTYILKLRQDVQPKELPNKDFFDVLTSLRRIGINLRQLAIKANTAGVIDTKNYWENVAELDKVISDLKDFMMN